MKYGRGLSEKGTYPESLEGTQELTLKKQKTNSETIAEYQTFAKV